MKNKQPTADRKVGYFQKNNEITTIYIGNLSYKLNERDIHNLFSQFGKVAYTRLIIDSESKRSKGIAFVQMIHENQALKAIDTLNESSLKGRTLKVSIAKDRLESGSNVRSRTVKIGKKDNDEKKTLGPRRRERKGLNKLFSYLGA